MQMPACEQFKRCDVHDWGKSMNRNENMEGMVQRAMQGDRVAFRRLLRQSVTNILYHSYVLLGNMDEAQMVSTDVAQRICAEFASLQRPELFRVWLHKMIVGECAKYTAKRSGQEGWAPAAEMGMEFLAPEAP